jgi:hypothetical protein
MTNYYLNECTLGKALYMIIPAIVNIDGGCSVCITSFVENVNDIFKMSNHDVRLEYDRSDEKQPVKVRIFDDLFGVNNG